MDCKILVVEALAQICQQTCVTVCHTAREALNKIDDNSYDIVITDLGLERGQLGGDVE